MNIVITSTGYWGVPGKPQNLARPPKVHAVGDGQPICGQRPGRRAEYQWCAPGLNLEMIDCEKCREIVRDKAMADHQALEELDRIRDNIMTLQQQLSHLAARVVKARMALTPPQTVKAKRR